MDFQNHKELNKKKYRVTMPNETVWEVPILVIALNHAEYYAEVDGVSLEEAMEDTVLLFLNDEYEIEDWARNNMYWADVMSVAVCVESPDTDFEEGWVNGDVEIV